MGEYLDALWNDLEQTWDLAMKVNDLSEKERGDVGGLARIQKIRNGRC